MYKTIILDVKPKLFSPQITTLQEQKDGSFLAGLLFAEKALLKIDLDRGTLKNVEDMKLEAELSDDLLGVTGGLRGTSTGDTAFATLHKGSAGLKSFFKKAEAPKTIEDFWLDLAMGHGSFGFSYKHSILQIVNGNFKLRTSKDSGAVLDVAHIGDFIFGLTGGSIFREPYLNSEKRYFLREDLETNFRFHKVEDGVFWLAGNESRLMKLNLTDIKALPTTKKVPGLPMRASVDCSVDGWLYAVAGSHLFRIRVNSENRLDELQVIKSFEDSIPLSVASQEISVKEGEAKRAKIWISLSTPSGTAMHSIESTRLEDNEELPPVPELKQEWQSDGIFQLNNLSYSTKHGLVGTCYNSKHEVQLFLD